jgi:hypothetical protein
MKKFNSIREFIDYAPECLFCGSNMKVVINANTGKYKKNNYELISQKVTGTALYRDVIEKSLLNIQYYYFSRVDDNQLIIDCVEKYWSNKQPQQTYEVLNINMKTSEVILHPKVEVGILNSFVRINFRFLSMCENNKCVGHIYSSTGIVAGARSKKIMPFFLREEALSTSSADDDVIYTLRSNYYDQSSQFEKSNDSKDYNNLYVGLSSSEPAISLPLIDMSTINTKEDFIAKSENYVIFS